MAVNSIQMHERIVKFTADPPHTRFSDALTEESSYRPAKNDLVFGCVWAGCAGTLGPPLCCWMLCQFKNQKGCFSFGQVLILFTKSTSPRASIGRSAGLIVVLAVGASTSILFPTPAASAGFPSRYCGRTDG